MILLLANYLNNIREKFITVNTPDENKKGSDIGSNIGSYIGIGSNIVWFYFLISSCAFLLSLYLNWKDNQPTSVCFLCALYAWGSGVFYFIFIAIYYLWYYSKNNYYYVEFSKNFDTKNLKGINITELENCINNLVQPK
jgi:hypothetical protein